MKTTDLKLEIKEWGSILDWQVSLENIKVGNWGYNASKKFYFKELQSYSTDGLLDVKMNCKGKNGASATLTIKIKGQEDETLKCIIQDGFSIEDKAITIKN